MLERPAAGIVIATASTLLLVALLAPFREDIGLVNAGFAFLLLTLLIASAWGREVGIYVAIISNIAFNFYFIEPYHTFTVHEPRNAGALGVFLIVSVVGGSLLAASKRAAQTARQQQAETEVALRLSRAMSATAEPQEALAVLCSEVVQVFSAPGAAVLTGFGPEWTVVAYAGEESASRPADTEERAAAVRAATDGTLQGLGMLGFSSARRRRLIFPGGRNAAFTRSHPVAVIPLQLGERTLGILRLDGPVGAPAFLRDPERLLKSVASEAAIALQRIELASAAAHAGALREADEMKNALMASISHDLKTPLAGIKAAITSLLDNTISWSPEDIHAFHQAIDSQTDRLNRVISDILDLNRLEAGALVPEREPIDVRRLLDEAREATRFETRDREVTLEIPVDFAVVADAALIRQAVINLLENAVKYSTAGGPIRLSATVDESDGVICVEDSGPGIAQQDLPFIFSRFYRAEESSRRVKGSGLGLTIVKGFVELCGGRVEVTSSPVGTCFLIHLPAKAREMVNT